MSKTTCVINFIGSPGCGKSVISAIMFAQLKLKHYVAEYVQEYAKQLVWTKDFDTLNNQYYVTKHQYKLLKQIDGKVDYIVTDGPLIHGLYYNKYNPDNTSDLDKTTRLILDSHHSFRNINIVLTRGDFEYEQEGRLQTESEARDIDVIMKQLLKNHQIDYKEFLANAEPANITRMVEYVLKESFGEDSLCIG
jgi:hypothetical protein